MGQIQFTISLVMIALFTVAIIGFALNFAVDNNSAVNLADDPELSSLNTKTKSNLSTFRGESQSTYASIINTTIEPGGTTAVTSGPFAVTPLNILGIVKNILQVGYIKIFGTGSGFGIFLTTFLSILGFIIALLIWKTLAGRLPD